MGRLAQKALHLIGKSGEGYTSGQEPDSRKPSWPNFRKDEIAFSIEATLKRINEYWKPGALQWVRTYKPDEWSAMISFEDEINRKAFEEDMNALNEALVNTKGTSSGWLKRFKESAATRRRCFESQISLGK